MITRVKEQRLLVISDLHLGNPFFKAKREINEFLDYAVKTNASICINGDGLDILQTSFRRISRDTPEVFSRFKKIADRGQRVYYVIGNHDLPLENFLENWGFVRVVPFLNVESADVRIHVEHGHLYDPLYLANPVIYAIATVFAGYLLKIAPPVYKLWVWYESSRKKARSRRSGTHGIKGEHNNYLEAAEEVMSRGFDTVIFGHTHGAGVVELGDGKQYVNTGTWLAKPNFVEIKDGVTELKPWTNGAMVN